MTITTDRTRVVMASRLNAAVKNGERIMLIRFANESDQKDAESGVPVIIKNEWKETEQT